LIRDFYAPRIRAQFEARLNGTSFDRRKWEDQWVHHRKGVSKIKPFKNPAVMAAQLVNHVYAEIVPPLPASKTFDKKRYKNAKSFAQWDPSQVKTTWQTVEWDFPVEQLKKLKGIAFVYRKGNHRLVIQSVALVADGKEVAIEKHTGKTGSSSENNLYKLKLPKKIQANNSCKIRAVIRSEGGNNSYGDILMVK